MTPLRQRMLEDMEIRNLFHNTQLSYLQQVSSFPPRATSRLPPPPCAPPRAPSTCCPGLSPLNRRPPRQPISEHGVGFANA